MSCVAICENRSIIGIAFCMEDDITYAWTINGQILLLQVAKSVVESMIKAAPSNFYKQQSVLQAIPVGERFIIVVRRFRSYVNGCEIWSINGGIRYHVMDIKSPTLAIHVLHNYYII